ncbi:class I SAM-dependent methyltransferase [Hoeflea sp. YIM 152468]|uniref:class I SAM-dependent methyltransferase n=1 Tax=Hoeflea sp. YIM 152468 TaxID=3031759 RepID=UPI0023DAB6E3|nr:class I SAM-dependent methyltransferase [Hoeflea sp. YIM 152468]MDF1608317.1 class I SAM-dependent methyltransferase [Hoeflea sp. YIM 152468]
MADKRSQHPRRGSSAKPGDGKPKRRKPRDGRPEQAGNTARAQADPGAKPPAKPHTRSSRAKAPQEALNARSKPSPDKQSAPRPIYNAPDFDRREPARQQVSLRPLNQRSGALPAQSAPIILESGNEDGYRLLDTGLNASGQGEKLEQYGALRIVRPEAQALWARGLPDGVWDKADAVFTGDTDEDGIGRWAFPNLPLGETWPMKLLDVDFHGRLTSFRHVGVFPEQIAHWRWMADQITAARRPLKVLNLFGYTGVASLVAAKAGAEVTHVDASKKAIGWARENQALAGLNDRPIRWICEDAMKFIAREERRGNQYDIILTDPPKFGRGPNGEVWQLFEHLPLMLDICRELLSPKPVGLVLTAYSIRASFYAIHELMRETMRGAGGRVESGELILRESGKATPDDCRALSTSLFARWLPQ